MILWGGVGSDGWSIAVVGVGVRVNYYIYYVSLVFHFNALHGLISRGRVRHYPCAGWKGLFAVVE